MPLPHGTMGKLLEVDGTTLTSAYVASTPFAASQLARRIRFYAHHIRSVGSAATTTKLKLQMRYADGLAVTGFVDLPSMTDAVPGVLEIEHSQATPANATTEQTFYLDVTAGLVSITVNVETTATGQAGDSTSVYAVAQ